MYFAIGLFVVTLAFIGVLLLNSGDDGNDEPVIALAEATPTSTAESLIAVTVTPTNTLPATPEPTATATATEAPTEIVIEEEPTPTEAEVIEEATEPVEVTEEPVATEEPVVEAEPTEAPVVGEFGQIPPPQIVSGGLQRELVLDYELAVSLDATPGTAPVYLLEWPERTSEDVAIMAGSIGINGDVEDQGSGRFRVLADSGELYVTPSTVQYVRTGDLPAGDLTENPVILEAARAWLYETGLIGTESGGGSIIGRDDDLGRAVALFKPAHPSPLLAFYPSATVTVGPDNTILEANVRWPANYIGSDYGLRSGDELWNLVLAGQGSLEADLSQVGGSGPLSGTMTVTNVTIAYSYASGDGEYLVPLVVFSGEAQLNEVDASVPVSIYVSAIEGQAAPRG